LVHYWYFIGHFDDQLPIHAGIPESDSPAGNDTSPTVQRFGDTGTLAGACRHGMLLPEQVAEIAKVMSQTARFMERATGIPAARQQQVLAIAAEIVQESSKLSTLAKSHDEPATQQCLQRIQVKVRELHEKP